jgi:hypothetical protein
LKNIYRISLFFILIHPLSIFSQNQDIKISGIVTDSVAGTPLVGTNILLYKDSLTLGELPYRGSVSNEYGFYVIPNLTNGTYYLIARYIGYKTVIRKIDIDISEITYRYDLKMTEENIELGEVVVEEKKSTAGLISTIDVSAELLKQLPSLSGEADLFKALQLLPGIKTASEISNGLYVRGGSPDQTLTLLDGVIIYNPAHLGNFASTFNSNALRDIRLIKGAFPAEYGGRLSSVLDLKLKSGTKERDKGTIGLGSINSHFELEGPLTENSTYMIAGRSMYYDFFQQSFDKNSIIPRYNFHDLNAKIYYPISENNILSISGMLSKDNIYSPDKKPKDANYKITWENIALSLNWIHINTKSLFSSTTLSYIDYQFESMIEDTSTAATASDYFSSSKLKDFSVKQDVELHWNPENTAKIGIDLTLHNYTLLYSNFFNELLETDPFAGTDLSSLEAALYAQNESQLTSRIKTNIGGRFYYFRDRRYFRFEPRVSASFAITDELFIKSAFAQAHQFLHLIVRNDIALPTDLWYPSTSVIEPSKSTQYVFGIDKYFANKEYLVTIESYYKSMKNLYEFVEAPKINPFESIEEQFTKGEGEAYGVEFFFNKGSGDLTGWIGYTLSWTKRQFNDLNLGRIFYPRYDRRHDVSIVAAYRLNNNLSVAATWIYSSGQNFTLPYGQYQFEDIGFRQNNVTSFNYVGRNAYQLPAYHKLDLNVTYKFNWLSLPFEAYLNIYNVYNRKNSFAQYVTLNGNNDENIPKSKQISLFPFIPTIGLNVKF